MQIQENPTEIKVKEYMNKYVKELQRHFEVSDERMRLILREVYRELKPNCFINNLISMVKSFYIKKGNNNGNQTVS